MKRAIAYSGSLIGAVVCFSLANRASQTAYPQSVFRELSRKVSPVLQLRSVKKSVESKGLTAIEIEVRDVEILISQMESPQAQEIELALEGRFAVENTDPLKISVEGDRARIELGENLRRKQWVSKLSGPMQGNRLMIRIPKRFSGRLKISTVSGSTTIEKIKALSEFDWESVSGNLSVIASEMFVTRLSSVSGNVEYDAASSELSAQLTSGEATFKFSGLDRFLNAKIDVFSTSGRLKIEVPRSASLRYALSSLTGSLESDLPGKPSEERGAGMNREGQLAQGAGELRARTISGDLIANLIDTK